MTPVPPGPVSAPSAIGRYTLFDELAAGGMATVHLGRLMGPSGFARTVAIKRLHAHFAKDDEFVTMFLDEARLAARLRHPNVVPIHDVVQTEDELFLVMDYVEGESLSNLLKAAKKAGEAMPLDIGVAIVTGALYGLHAAHEATDDAGQPLNLVHRDVSPQNILVGVTGVSRILDFGIAKAAGRAQTTAEGQIKGKLAYMALEQMGGDEVDRRVDVYSAGVVLWEVLANRKRYNPPSHAALLAMMMEGKVVAPSTHRPEIPPALDAIVMRALSRNPDERFATARELALAIEEVVTPATTARVGAWVQAHAATSLQKKARLVRAVESGASSPGVPASQEMGDPTVVSSPSAISAAGAQKDSSDAGTLASLGLDVPRASGTSVRYVVAALAVAGVASAVTFLVGQQSAVRERVEVLRPASGLTVAAAPSEATSPSATSPSATSPSATSPSATAVPSASASPSSTARSPEPRAAQRPPAAPPATPKAVAPPPPPKPAAAGRCNPPFTTDARGVKHIKPGCL